MYESIKSNFRRIVAAHCVLENFIALERTGNVGGAPRYSDCFVYILSGRARYEFSDYSFVVSAGEILYLPKGGVYEIEKLTDEYRFIFVDFDFERTIAAKRCALPIPRRPKSCSEKWTRLFWNAPSGGSRRCCPRCMKFTPA